MRAAALAPFPLLALIALAPARPAGDASTVAGAAYQGEAVTCDFPEELNIWNKGSDVDRKGLCVGTSVYRAGRYQNVPGLDGWLAFIAGEPGGADPKKLDDQLTRYYAKRGEPVPPFWQYQGPNPEPVFDMIDKTGRMGCTTYGYSPRYPQGTIYHMNNCVRYGGRFGVAFDNNPVGIGPGRLYEWMEPAELVRRAKHPRGEAWVFVWTNPPPPPPPRN